MSASWLVIDKGEVTANQRSERFVPEFGKLLQPVLDGMLQQADVDGLLAVQADGSTLLVIQSRPAVDRG